MMFDRVAREKTSTCGIPRRALLKSRTNKLIVRHFNQTSPLSCTLPAEIKEMPLVSKMRRSMEDNMDAKSIRSNLSNISKKSKISSRSLVASPPLIHFDCQTDKISDMCLVQLEKTLDQCLKERIRMLMAGKDGPVDDQYVSELNQKLEQLTKKVLQKTLQNFDENKSTTSIYRTIDRKVQLIERILSEKYVQSDIIKTFYQLTSYNRTEYGKLGRNKHSFENLKMSRSSFLQSQEAKKFLTKSSVNQESFGKPSKEGYNIYRQEKQKYYYKPQTLPPTSYKENYLNYTGVMALKGIKGSEQHTLNLPYNNSAILSTYDKEFVHRPAKPENFRELDSFKDKIKTLKLKYSHREVKPSKQLTKTMAKLERQYSVRPQLKPIVNKASETHFISSARKDLGWRHTESIIQSRPKNSRLDSLHRLYKKSLH